VTLEFFDYRTDLKNFLITPEIRSRFMRIEPGTTTGSHTHDLGHEVFLVMEGTIEFDVAGRKAVLTAGQMCVALVDEPHTLRVIGDQPATIYLSVTPHIAPTHTRWDDRGNKLPPKYDTVVDGWEKAPATAEMVDQQVAAARAVAEAAAASLAAHERVAAELKKAIAEGDAAGARAAVDAMWERISPLYASVSTMAGLWNSLAPRAAPGAPEA
jgi:quercetin dioxygenase-like cupin family protein